MAKSKNAEYKSLETAKKKIWALDHDTRQKIIALLRSKGKLSVTEIYKTIRIEQSVASQHLSILRKANLVATTPEGKQRLYSVNEDRVQELKDNAAKI